tara:strand:- start:80 stop:541 length:462 start_codon:yes stop_codon:yes gene_type:complete
MRVSDHVIYCLPLSLAFSLYLKSPLPGLLCLASGVLIDVDHTIEYVQAYGFNLGCLKKLLIATQVKSKNKKISDFKKMYLIFHSLEFVIIFWIIGLATKNLYFISAISGYSLHILLDFIGNREYPRFYWIIWRAKNKFLVEKILRVEINKEQL